MALAMTDIILLGELLQCDALKQFKDPYDWFSKRDEIKKILAAHRLQIKVSYWLAILETLRRVVYGCDGL